MREVTCTDESQDTPLTSYFTYLSHPAGFILRFLLLRFQAREEILMFKKQEGGREGGGAGGGLKKIILFIVEDAKL